MTKEEMEVVNRIKFEFAKMGIEIFEEKGFDFKCKINDVIGQIYTEKLVARYLMLKTNSQKTQLIKAVMDSFLGNNGLGGVAAKLT